MRAIYFTPLILQSHTNTILALLLIKMNWTNEPHLQALCAELYLEGRDYVHNGQFRQMKMCKIGFKVTIDLDSDNPHEELTYMMPRSGTRIGDCGLCKLESRGLAVDKETIESL